VTSTLWRPPPLGPGGRPFRGWRVVPILLSVASFGVNLVVLLSDRAPGLLSRLSSRIDAGVHRAAGAAGVDVPGGSVRVPQSDFDVHLAIWAVAALLVGLAMWSWASLVMGSAAVLVASIGIELAQQAYTRSRTVQFTDVLGNTVGIVTGTCAVAAFALVWRLFLSTRRSPPPG
jgi:multisubunit Na+/H+ antiporter MnhG subunit